LNWSAEDAPDVVDLAGLERLDHRVAAREVLEDDLVLGALLRAPVVGVAGEADVVAGHPLDGLVRARPDDGRLVLEEAGASGSPISASVYFDQMCFGRIGT
jgi:hypothetical protein